MDDAKTPEQEAQDIEAETEVDAAEQARRDQLGKRYVAIRKFKAYYLSQLLSFEKDAEVKPAVAIALRAKGCPIRVEDPAEDE